jgi:L-2-hydroxyglutarate oxidase LhgO
MEKVDVVVVGAGVVGLAIASEIAGEDREIYVLEKERGYGQATSSRNSEVIHAGIYYPKGSLKAELCVRANPIIYRICRENNIAHRRLGKIVVANGEAEVRQLEGIIRNARECGARDLELIDPDRVHGLEPRVRADAAILSPTTGIVDAHGLIDHFYREARRKCGVDPLVLDTEVTGLKQRGDGYAVEVASGGESYSVEARVVVNAAGLHADRVAEMAGIDVERVGYRLHWCKGDYFSLTGSPPARMLVYPPPPKDETSLGIHTVPDLTGRLRFGPNAYYVDRIDYRVESDGDGFWRDIVKYLPMIGREDLHPDMSGIRAKLQGPGDPVRDFVIRHEEDRGFPGLINLIGIESPGLTCAPAIAEMVAGMVEEFF